jgi:formylglycine-generating enzyme required for sulfatase activity
MISHGGVKQPNGWGLFDMHGNLKEWTSSLILANRSKPDPLKPFQSTAASAKPHRVVRGGGLFQEAIHCRSAYRDWELEDTVSTDIGFRVVLVNLPVKGTNEVALPKK